MRHEAVECCENHSWASREEKVIDGKDCVVRICEKCSLCQVVWSIDLELEGLLCAAGA